MKDKNKILNVVITASLILMSSIIGISADDLVIPSTQDAITHEEVSEDILEDDEQQLEDIEDEDNVQSEDDDNHDSEDIPLNNLDDDIDSLEDIDDIESDTVNDETTKENDLIVNDNLLNQPKAGKTNKLEDNIDITTDDLTGVEIEDEVLESIIRDTLSLGNKGVISQGDMNKLYDLEIDKAGVTSLSGLEYAHNLVRFAIVLPEGSTHVTKLESIEPLLHVDGLKNFEIRSKADIPDLEQLANINYSLTTLMLYEATTLGDLSFVDSLYNLSTFGLLENGEKIVSFDPSLLSDLTDLRFAIFINVHFETQLDLSQANDLFVLILEKTNVTNLDFMENMRQISEIDLKDNPLLESITPLKYQERMSELSIEGSPLLGQSKIEINSKWLYKMTLNNIGLKDLSWIKDIPSTFAELNISNNDLQDLSPLTEVEFDSIAYLALDNNNIKSVESLRNLKYQGGLLNLDGNHITDLSPLADRIKNKVSEVSLRNQIITIPEVSLLEANIIDVVNYDGTPLNAKRISDDYSDFTYIDGDLQWSEFTPEDNTSYNTLELHNRVDDTTHSPENLYISYIVTQQVNEADIVYYLNLAKDEITFVKGSTLSEIEFLDLVEAETNSPNPITTTLSSVNFNKVGDYIVVVSVETDPGVFIEKMVKVIIKDTDPEVPIEPEVPTEPEIPTEPETPVTPETPETPDTPNTGIMDNVTFYLQMMVIACSVILLISMRKYKTDSQQ